ncbi:hypothetical protein SNE40_003397 [Patella caerulea]|uniref:Reverse transcriptase domain-containing protein n=1 Tax=Patella caerulea TaxID=87958 RepID=A0AAN8KDV7_PATCE
MSNIRFVSINCRSFISPQKSRIIARDLRDMKVDIAFLQDTNICYVEKAKFYENVLGGKCIWSFGSRRSTGVGIVLFDHLNFVIRKINFDFEGRLVVVDVDINNAQYRLICIYAPVNCADRNDFLLTIPQYLTCKRYVIWGGDFNFVMDPLLDKVGGNIEKGTIGKCNMNDILKDFNLNDAYRLLYPNIVKVTWRGNSVACRFDRFYVSKALFNKIVSSDVLPCAPSDHDYVLLELNVSDGIKIGEGYWKFNSSILNDRAYVSLFTDFWIKSVIGKVITIEWWEGMKISIKNLTKDYCKKKARLKRKIAFDLEKRFRILADAEARSPGLYIGQINALKKQLYNHKAEVSQGAYIRSRALQLDNEQVASRIFQNRENRKGENKIIQNLEDKDGNLANDMPSILDICKNFYSELFSEESIEESIFDEFLNDLPKLDDYSQDVCEGKIRPHELILALNGMQNDKSPGPDGICKEFYDKFNYLLGDVLVSIYNLSFDEGMLPFSQRQCYITLLCKDLNQKHLLKYWRPISLLNVDYKLLSKILQLRLRSVLDEIVEPDQTCAVMGRSISDNLHLLRSVIDYVDQKDLSVSFICLDQAKAFDRVNHNFLFTALEHYSFGPMFLKWIKLLYTDIYSSVIVNGHVSDNFSVTRSVRQGCSLSPLLYILSLEPFYVKVRNDKQIKGIVIPGSGEEAKIVGYADDTTGICSTVASVERLLFQCKRFSVVSGSKLNLEKTKGLCFGKFRTSSDHVFGISWPDKAKILGVYFGRNISEDDNWSNIFKKFTANFTVWKSTHLSIFGRCNVAKILACSKLWYVSQVLPLPNHYYKMFKFHMFRYIWASRFFEPVRRTALYGKLKDGGLNILDIETKIKSFLLNHILKILKCHGAKWVEFAKYWIGFSLRHVNSELGSNLRPHSANIPVFYRECLSVFRDFCKLYPDFDWHGNWNSRSFYDLLISKIKTEPRCFSLFSQVDFKLSFSNCTNIFVDPLSRETTWKSIHYILPTSSCKFITSHTENKFCNFCNVYLETQVHLMYNCKYVKRLWETVHNWVFDLSLGEINLNVWHVIFNTIPTKKGKYIHNVILCIVALARRHIWATRCDVKYRHKTVSDIGILLEFVEKLRIRIWADRFRLSETSFKSHWLNPGMFCNLDNGNLSFLFDR